MAAFEASATVVLAKPDRLQLVFGVTQAAGSTTRAYAGSFDFAIPTNDGREVERRKGNLIPHLTAPQITSIVAFLNTMMDKAQDTVA